MANVRREPGRRGRVLDVVAFAALAGLGAEQVVLAVRSENGWRVEGEASSAGPPSGESSSLVLTFDPPARVPLRVRLEEAPDGLLRVSMVGPLDEAEESAEAIAVAGPCSDGSTVLLVVDRPGALHRDRWLELLASATDGVVVQADGQRARLRESVHEREEERRRWARELHDDTLQEMGALHVLLTSAVRQGGEQAREHGLGVVIATAAGMVARQIAGLRHLINELRPAALDELGLRPPLEALAERTERLSGMRVQMRVSLPYADGQLSTRLLPDIELAVYRVVQEALANAARHSDGSHATVVVVELDDHIVVEVSDDGSGPGQAAGFGIDGMRERAALAGGHLEVLPRRREADRSGPGGTLVRMVVPAIHRSSPGGSA